MFNCRLRTRALLNSTNLRKRLGRGLRKQILRPYVIRSIANMLNLDFSIKPEIPNKHSAVSG